MTRFRKQKATVGVSLFPFLAVLICTMGALIVLLVLVVQMARVDASEDADASALQQEADSLQAKKEDYQWRREMLEQQRLQLQQQVAGKRLELSHLEEHIRELEKEWDALREAALDLRQRLGGEATDQQQIRAELERLQEAIHAAEKELDEARKRAANQPPVYAIVPYEGPNGTFRRPIYIECREDGVVIQPEGILFPVSDFQGPLGPGNPLDAALRAIREYYARLGNGASQGEPYPLLIVRPGGVESYAMARAAMRSWDDEFGYELIEESMQLKYPEADPALNKLLDKAVADARSRQAILAAAMPSQYGKSKEVGFVATPSRGGFVPKNGSRAITMGQRRGGFGQGGDSRYVDGRASGQVQGQAPAANQQTVGGSMEKGNADGKPNASRGAACSPLARQRGRNWGLPGANENATGIVRPIRMAVLPDRLIILPDRGQTRVPEVILLEGSMVDEIDQFVSSIWDRIEQWGIAVAGGYWKPVLHVNVAQGAEERFQELTILLEGSGLEVKRSGQ